MKRSGGREDKQKKGEIIRWERRHKKERRGREEEGG